MAQPGEINLLRAKTGRSPELVALVGQLRTVSILALTGVLSAGALIGGSFFFLKMQSSSLESQKQQLTSEISLNARKETLLLVVKQQLGVAGRILARQKQWGPVIEAVSGIVAPPALTSFTVSDKQEITIRMKTGTLDEAVSIVSRVMSAVQQNVIKNPMLVVFELGRDGSVKMAISFVAIM